MLIQYNRIVIGSFKDFFQTVNTNNLAEVLQALKELNFILANRAPELASHYIMLLEPWQITAEEVPGLVRVHLNHTTAYNLEHSIRWRPHSRCKHHHQYSRQSLLLPRYNQHSERSEAHYHRNHGTAHIHVTNQCNSPHTDRNTPNISHNQVNPIAAQSPNIIECLQSQILGLQTQALQQSTLNSMNILTVTAKANSHCGPKA